MLGASISSASAWGEFFGVLLTILGFLPRNEGALSTGLKRVSGSS